MKEKSTIKDSNSECCASCLILSGTIFISLLVIGLIYQGISNAVDLQTIPLKGTMIDMDDHFKMHLYCVGAGNITVVLFSGAGDTYVIWEVVQNEIMDDTRVCAFDRPGLGRSDFWPGGVPTVSQHVQFAFELLRRAGEHPPYISIGHSVGGVLARTFAKEFRNEVISLILVDSSVEGQISTFDPDIVEANKAGDTILSVCNVIAPFGIVRLLGLGNARAAAFPLLSEEARLNLAADFHNTKGCKSFKLDGQSARAILENGEPFPSLGDILLTVLTGGIREEILDTPEQRNWNLLQSTLLDISSNPNSDHVYVNDSGHYIHTTRPDIVIEAIETHLIYHWNTSICYNTSTSTIDISIPASIILQRENTIIFAVAIVLGIILFILCILMIIYKIKFDSYSAL